MAVDDDVLDRLRAATPERSLDLPLGEVVREGRRRRRSTRALIAVACVAIVIVAVATPRIGAGTRGAGFTVFERDDRAFIGLVIPSEGMSPTFVPGDIAAVNVEAYVGATPVSGDVVAFTLPSSAECSEVFVKRVVGVAGDTVEQIDGRIVVNGEVVPGLRDRREDVLGPWVVEPGHLFVVGDDLEISNDSRYALGQVAVANVLGRVEPSVELDRADIPAPPACAVSVTTGQ